MNALRFLFVLVLLGLTNAYNGPYASFTNYWNYGCNETVDNFVYSLYLYPADGSCISPSGGGGELTPSYGYRITYNQTTVSVSTYYYEDCTGPEYSPEYYPRDACADYSVASIYQTLPPNQYWVNLGIVGYGNQTWETVLVTSYYSSFDCNSFSDIQIQGWSECNYGSNFYCQNDELHYDACTDTTTCASGCVEVYAPLSDACTATSNAPSFWSAYLDTSYATSYQASCAGAVPSPSATPTPSSSPSAFPSSLPPSDSSSSSDGPADGVWVLLMIICFLVGVIVGLLLGLVIYGKLNAKKRSAEANNGYIQLPPYGMPMPFFPPPQQ